MRHSCGHLIVFAGVTATGENVYACTESRAHALLRDIFFDAQGRQLQSVNWAKRRKGDVELVDAPHDIGYRGPLILRNSPTSFAAKVWAIEQRIGRRVAAYRRMSLQRNAPRTPETRAA